VQSARQNLSNMVHLNGSSKSLSTRTFEQARQQHQQKGNNNAGQLLEDYFLATRYGETAILFAKACAALGMKIAPKISLLERSEQQEGTVVRKDNTTTDPTGERMDFL